LSVKLPPIVNVTAVLIVSVEVYPDVKVNERIVTLAETVDASFPCVPAPSKVTSEVVVGVALLVPPPDVADQLFTVLQLLFAAA
jgi:hypothetical protein